MHGATGRIVMVKLATAREIRLYGPGIARKRAEYINAGLYLFATIVHLGGFLAEMSREPRSGLVLLMIALWIIIAVNLHDLLAHLAGINYRMSLVWLDVQLAFVEIAVPIINSLGSLLTFLGVLFLFVQAEKGQADYKLEWHAMNLLIAGPALWLLGSVHNSCQVYETAGAHVQILQESVVIPFLTGSLLFLVAAIVNAKHQARTDHHGMELLGRTWVWLCVFGSLLFVVGGLANVVKVFRIQQLDEMMLEKLRGGAHEQLVRDRDGIGRALLVTEDPEWRSRRRRRQLEEEEAVREAAASPLPTSSPAPTPYKDVHVGHP